MMAMILDVKKKKHATVFNAEAHYVHVVKEQIVCCLFYLPPSAKNILLDFRCIHSNLKTDSGSVYFDFGFKKKRNMFV